MVWLLRHGEAEEHAADDASRPLTERGRAQAEAAGGALRALGVPLETCLSSPKLRASETARLAAGPLGLEVEIEESLAGGDFDLEGLVAGRGEALIVGHEPDLSRAVQLHTGGRIKLRKGGLAALEQGVLRVLIEPAHVGRIGARQP